MRDSVDRYTTRRHQGLPGYWAVLFVRAMATYLAGRAALNALSQWRPCCLQVLRDLGLCRDCPFDGCHTMAHTFAYLRINATVTDDAARLATGLPGSALTGRDLHPLDDNSEFQGGIDYLLSQTDQHCLVASEGGQTNNYCPPRGMGEKPPPLGGAFQEAEGRTRLAAIE